MFWGLQSNVQKVMLMKNKMICFMISMLAAAPWSGLNANEVRNGDFSEATRFWFVFVNGGFRETEAMAAYMKTHNEGLYMLVDEIPGEKTQPAAVTLNQRVQGLQAGKEYVLRFQVKGHRNESMLVGVGKPVTSGAHRGNLSGGAPVREIALEAEWKDVEMTFVYNGDHSLTLPEDARETLVQFRVGTVSTLHLRAVSVTEK